MKTIFNKVKIEKIEFQSNSNEVSVSCKIGIGELNILTEIMIDFSDLNKLIGKIQHAYDNFEILNYFRKTDLKNGFHLYSFESKNSELREVYLENLDNITPLKEIRA